jgi:hypothetical protein
MIAAAACTVDPRRLNKNDGVILGLGGIRSVKGLNEGHRFKLHLRLRALLGTGTSLSEQWHVMPVNARNSAAHHLRAVNFITKSQPPQCVGSTPVES